MPRTDPIPEGLLYHPEHQWARIDGDSATFGITDYAQDLLGEVVFWDAPQAGAQVKADQPYTELESMKAISEVFAPLTGEITEVNDTVADDPVIINDDPYGAGWLVRVALADHAETAKLLTAAGYRELTQQ